MATRNMRRSKTLNKASTKNNAKVTLTEDDVVQDEPEMILGGDQSLPPQEVAEAEPQAEVEAAPQADVEVAPATPV